MYLKHFEAKTIHPDWQTLNFGMHRKAMLFWPTNNFYTPQAPLVAELAFERIQVENLSNLT
jgi:hypothetical protein